MTNRIILKERLLFKHETMPFNETKHLRFCACKDLRLIPQIRVDGDEGKLAGGFVTWPTNFVSQLIRKSSSHLISQHIYH